MFKRKYELYAYAPEWQLFYIEYSSLKKFLSPFIKLSKGKI